jgi:citrate lyase subunit beta/citryl-CoA lyase
MSAASTLRRSWLYMPGANARALVKAREIDCDGVVFDLEDAVAVAAKALARRQVVDAVTAGGFGHRELIVRVNGLDTPWGAADVDAVARLPVHGLLFPKIETVAQVDRIVATLDAAGIPTMPIWFMIETPLAVLDVRQIATRSTRLRGLVMGTSDLVKELRAQHTAGRENLGYALQRCLTVARACALDILDGVHLEFRNLDSFRRACEQGRAMGFDGKTLIHPAQVETANTVFGFSANDIEQARRVRQIWEQAQAAARGVAELDGKLIENLHAAEAERILAFAAALERRAAP